jgi:hypothetical protein
MKVCDLFDLFESADMFVVTKPFEAGCECGNVPPPDNYFSPGHKILVKERKNGRVYFIDATDVDAGLFDLDEKTFLNSTSPKREFDRAFLNSLKS